MACLVPVLEFIHELRNAGLHVDAWDVLDRPREWWERVPAEQQKRLLVRHEAPFAADAVAHVSTVRRRGRPAAAENVFVRLEAGEPRTFPRSLLARWDRVVFRPLAEAGALTDVESFGAPQSFSREVSWGRGRRRVLEVLDDAWDDEGFDIAAEGHLASLHPIKGFEEVDRYWVEEPFAIVGVMRDDDNEMVYQVEEPVLTDLEKSLLVTLNERLRDVLVLERKDADPALALSKKVFDLLRMYRYRTDRRTAYKLGYYFVRNYLGFGRLEPLMRDALIEDVSCNGPGLPLFVAHSRHQTLRTNLVFDELELNSFTIKLAQRGGKLLSVAEPLVDATLPDGSRIQACLGREVTSHGSSFTIRKFREDPLTCVDLIASGTHSADTMALLWLAVELRRSVVVMGATASGKTTTLNCLSQFIPPNAKIVTIEDTREITLQHENWLAAVTRDSATGEDADRITMFDLLRAALRQRPEYILVGEIRGEEGVTLFQAMSTGHTCFSTMHAGNVENAVYRLENAPIGVPRVMLTSLDFLLLQGQVDREGRPARRMLSLTEISGIDSQSRNLRTNEVVRWDAAEDRHLMANDSHIIQSACEAVGWSRSRLDEELAARRRVLEDLVASGTRHYRDVARAVRRYYAKRGQLREGRPPQDAPATRVPVSSRR